MFKVERNLSTTSFIVPLLVYTTTNTTAYAIENSQADINATNLYKTHNMVLGNNVKNLETVSGIIIPMIVNRINIVSLFFIQLN
jgi:hypothetical protein